MAAKTDMERIGVFSESGYTTISDPYIPPSSSKLNSVLFAMRSCAYTAVVRNAYYYWCSLCACTIDIIDTVTCLPLMCTAHLHVHIHFLEAFNESAAKGKQMVIGGTKSKTSSQSGYFDAAFSRILQVQYIKCNITRMPMVYDPWPYNYCSSSSPFLKSNSVTHTMACTNTLAILMC